MFWLFWTMGTVHSYMSYMSMQGSVWFISQVMAQTFLLLSVITMLTGTGAWNLFLSSIS